MWRLRALVATLCWLPASPERTEFGWHVGHGASFLLQRTNLAPEAPAVPQEAQHGRALHCREGRLELSGDYEVRERLVLQGPCNVSATRAKLRLRAPVVFNGSVALSGSLSVEAKEAAPFQEACVSVNGTLLLNAGAFLGMEGCRTKRSGAKKGAGLNVTEDLLSRGALAFTSCHAVRDGGAAWVGGNIRLTGELHAESCSASGSGGVLSSGGNMTIANASLEVQNATAGFTGGVLSSQGNIEILNASLKVHNARADSSDGGVLFSKGNIEIVKASLKVQNASAMSGGVLFSRGNIEIVNASLEVHNSRAKMKGGALAADNGKIEIANASLEVHNATAGWRGGALDAFKDIDIANTYLQVHNSMAQHEGGALYSGGKIGFVNASLEVQNATARYGGALQSSGNIEIVKTYLQVHNASATKNGGVLSSRGNIEILNASLQVHNARAGHDGGSLNSVGNIEIVSASLQIHNTAAVNDGGAFLSGGNMTIVNASLQVHNATARGSGGALHVHQHLLGSGRWVLEDCQAQDAGGGIFVKSGNVNLTGIATFNRCRCLGRTSVGGAVHVKEGNMAASGQVIANDCTAGMGDAVYAGKELRLDTAVLAGRTTSLMVGVHATIARLVCRHAANDCFVDGPVTDVPTAECARGAGLQRSGTRAACQKCPEGQIRLAANSSKCQRCPRIRAAVSCTSARLEIPPGYMVNASNFTDWHRCPNTATCPGGKLKAGEELEDAVEVRKPMCARGYAGPGCMRCAAEFAWADSAALQCIHCSTSQRQVLLFIFFYLAKEIGLFISAVATVTSGKAENNKSSVMLNQLMAFAAVGSIAMSGAMQTSAFRHLQDSANNGLASLLTALELPVAFAQGRSASSSFSNQCLLRRWGLDSSFVTVHWATSILPALLLAVLVAAKGIWVAIVVGVNVFLPTFTSAFGRYLVAYRLRPEGQGSVLQMDFLPSGSPPAVITIILTSILLCFLFAIGSWAHIVRTRKEPFQQHVAYLMASYKPSCAAWEVERLCRKMLLGLVPALLPVSISPALQMGAVSLILIASLFLYVHYQPYKVDFWNQLEMALLFVALAIMTMTSCLVANDFHWAHSGAMQAALLYMICVLASGVSTAMIVAIARALYDERR